MGSQPNPSTRVSFGPFEFEHLSGDLRKFGSRIRLQGKPLQILSILLAQPGAILSRDELQRHLWHRTTFVDFEQGLNTAVNKLRQALGDSADQPRYIETVPGKGYRFIAPLHFAGSHGAASHSATTRAVLEMAPPYIRPQSAPDAEDESGAPRAAPIFFRTGAIVTGVITALAIVMGAGYWLATRRAELPLTAKPARFTVTPPPGYALEGAVGRQSFALSPDGTHLAFTAMNTSGEFRAFVRDLNSLEARPLPGSDGVHTLFWAPDSRSLFWTANGKIQRAPLDGDARVVLGDSPGYMSAGAWLSPERLLLACSLTTYWMPPSGGSPTPLREFYRWPQVLPDGEHILYVALDSPPHRFRARVARLDEPGSARDLFESDSQVLYTASSVNTRAGYLMYVRAGNLLARPFDPDSLRVTGEAMPLVNKVYTFWPTAGADFSVASSGAIAYQTVAGRSQLVWVDRKGRQVGTAGPANINVKSGSLSPDGRKMVTAIYDVERGAQNLWVVDVRSNAARELTLEPGVRDSAVWSPDSKTLAFLHGVGNTPQVHIRGMGENDQEEALAPTGFQMPTDWSPDGRFIVFENTGIARLSSEVQSDVFMFDLAHGRKVIPVLSSRFHEANAAFSPDGKWLTFTSNESGRPEVYIQAFESTGTPRVTGERYLVSRSGAQALHWRRDGKELFYIGLDGRVYAVSARLRSAPEFGPATPLFTISLEARAAIHSVLGFDVSPDGGRFLIPAVSSLPGPSLVVMQNWEAALPQWNGKK